MVENRPLGSRRLTEHMMQGLMIRLRHHLFHPLHVLRLRLNQPLHIVPRGRLNGSRPLAKMTPKLTAKDQESPTHPGQQAIIRRRGGVFFDASKDVSSIRYLILSL